VLNKKKTSVEGQQKKGVRVRKETTGLTRRKPYGLTVPGSGAKGEGPTAQSMRSSMVKKGEGNDQRRRRE